MSKTRDADVNEVAARVVRESTAKHEKPLPANVEAAWAEWSRAVQDSDPRMMALLRAAFEAGVEAASSGNRKC